MKPRFVRALVASALLSAAAAGGLVVGTAQAQPPADAAAVKACTATTFEFPEVEKACKKGGQPAAKALMKKAVQKAKAAGEATNCKSCHVDVKAFELKPNAVDDLRRWL